MVILVSSGAVFSSWQDAETSIAKKEVMIDEFGGKFKIDERSVE